MADSDVSDFYDSEEYSDEDTVEDDIEEEDIEDEDIDEVEDEVENNDEESDEESVEDEGEVCYARTVKADYLQDDEVVESDWIELKGDDRITRPVMFYYELVRLIGTRAQQFNLGAKPLVQGLEGLPTHKMAYLEIISHMTPFIIRRFLPYNKYEEWRVDELLIPHVITDEFFLPGKFDWDALMSHAQKNAEYVAMVRDMQEASQRNILD